MEKKEIWKDVNNYEGLYQVSNLGRVKSLSKIVLFSDGRKRRYKESIRKQHFNVKRGYYYVSLKVKGKTKTISIHTLVYRSFKDYDKNLVIDHIDNNQRNNNLENLQQISNRENLSKDKKNGTSKYTGVCWHKKNKKWMSSIHHNNKNIHLGYFSNEIDASNAYKNALKKIKNG